MVALLANTITADMGFIPGMAIVSPAMGLPLSVLAAFIERPFVSGAGVRRNAIWYSLQANLISLLVGYVGVIGAMLLGGFLRLYDELPFLVWPPLAVAVSIVVERGYLNVRAQRIGVRWRWIIAGNLLSAGICIAIVIAAGILRAAQPAWRYALAPYERPLTITAGVGSVLLFIVAFCVPSLRRKPVLETPAVAPRSTSAAEAAPAA
jgi:hypothetical protein